MRARHGWAAAGAVAVLLSFGEAGAQSADRMWGTVRTTSGERHDGFLRWDRNETSWADILDGERDRDAALEDSLALWLGEEVDDEARSVEYLGVRITWEDDGPPPGAVESGVRFGHLRWLRPTDDGSARVGLKSGEEFELRGGGSDLGAGFRGLVVEPPGRDAVEMGWSDIEEVEFGAAPAGARPAAPRLHGTVEDRWGERWTGSVVWDRDETLATDILDGEDEDGREREIAFARVAEVERRFAGGSRVVTTEGEEWILDGTNDVGRGHRGVQVVDPALGEVALDWRDVAVVRFSAPPEGPGYGAYAGGRELWGTVETDDGSVRRGRIVWDADEARSWEILNGSWRDVEFRVELAQVARIERRSSRAARVTLVDGRVLELEGSNDVNDGNRGIVVKLEDGTVEVIGWDRFVAVDFGPGGGA